jgi:hypothetical protein
MRRPGSGRLQWSPPKGVAFALLRAYLRVFASFAPNPAHARQEHSLIEGSVVEAYQHHRGAGSANLRAAWLSFREHIAELQPLALAQKTRHDSRNGPRGRYPYWTRVAAAPIGMFLMFGGAFAIWGLTASAEADPSPSNTVARVFPVGDPRAGQVEILATFSNQREALFAASGGTVCLPPGSTTADLPKVLPTIAPGDTESCADLRGPPLE